MEKRMYTVFLTVVIVIILILAFSVEIRDFLTQLF